MGGFAERLRLFLASRRLFRNWLWADLEYFLARRGLIRVGGIAVVCRDGSRDVVPVDVYRYLLYDNYLGIVERYLCGERAIRYINGVAIPVEERDKHERELVAMAAAKRGWRYERGYWVKNGVKFKRMHGPVLQVFEFGEYGYVDAAGKVVVDVGAYVGDSAIYFATRGAKRVIAIEPHPEAYREMLENIKLNGLEDKIIPINAGLASRHGRICLEDVDADSTGGTYHRPGDCASDVEAITLGEALSKYVDSDDRPLLLKMDCEGCEYDVILNDYENVRKFDELVLEYHERDRPAAELLAALRTDYKCRLIRRHKGVGIVKCVRR